MILPKKELREGRGGVASSLKKAPNFGGQAGKTVKMTGEAASDVGKQNKTKYFKI